MTNIWTQSFEEVRKPFFEMDDPYTKLEEKKAERDYDGDGKVESGAKEHAGAVHNAIQRKKGGKPDGQDTSSVKEESLLEIQNKVSKGAEKKVDVMKGKNTVTINPQLGMKEEVEAWVNELVEEGYDLSDYTWDEMYEFYLDEAITSEKGKAKAAEMIAARSTPSGRAKSGQGANVAQINHISRANVDNLGGTPPNPKIAKNPVKSRSYGGTGNKAARRAGLTPTREKPNAWEEEFEFWVNALVEEGYDLSEFTWDEMTEIYESAELNEGTAEMPARGDAETMNVTDTQMASAKRRAAQAQIRADMARVQLQKASMTKESFDSIVEYLSNRSDAFQNLEEGVFDPKKSKMRPASQRSQRTMTPAQRTAAKKEAERTAAIHSKGETVLTGLRSSGRRGRVQTTPSPKPAAPASNRTVRGRYDKLAAAASKVLKDINR